MGQGINVVVVPVRDLERAKRMFVDLLGTEPHTDQPYYVGFSVGNQELGLDPNGHAQGLTGTVSFFQVDDIDKRLQSMIDGGATVQQPVREVGGGRRIASVTDPDGNIIGLMQDE